MAFDYAAMAQVAVELLAEFGAAGTLTRNGGTSTLNADGSASPVGSAASVAVQMIELGREKESSTDESGVRAARATHLLAPIIPPPLSGDTLGFNGKTLTISSVRTSNPAGTVLCHFVTAGTA